MNKCLVTKLQGIVDNKKLLKIGEARFKARTTDISNAVLSINAKGTFSTDKPVLLNRVNVTEGSSENASIKFIDTNEVTFTISNKYGGVVLVSTDDKTIIRDLEGLTPFLSGQLNISNTSELSMNINELSKNKFIQINLGGNGKGIYGDLSSLKNTECSDITITASAVTGSINDLPSNVKKLNITSSDNITGDISKVTWYEATYIGTYNTNVYGEIKTYLDACVANGRTSGTLNFDINQQKCSMTLNGKVLSSSLNIQFSESGWSKV